ncbi:MAG: DUF1223 domain-containing protein [Planctomycetota bacterium]
MHHPPYVILPLLWSGIVLANPGTAWSQSGTRVPVSQPQARTATGVAVVELFTSQGCSSCPPADEVLREIDRIARERNLPVYALSFHVDYWNRLGWDDPYSQPQFTTRQQAYARSRQSTRVYTPQMIVGGSTEFVGSNQALATRAINQSLKRDALVRVAVEARPDSTTKGITVDYELAGPTRGKLLNVALVDTPTENPVPRGENAGRSLSHVNVVRAFETVKLEKNTGRLDLSPPPDLRLTDATVLAYVQDPDSLAIVGAAPTTVRD